MNYSITVEPPAVADIAAIFAELEEFNPGYAEKWITAIHAAIHNLTPFPKRHPVAPESKHTSVEIRHLLVSQYRILFQVRGEAIHVIHVRHASRRPFKPGELG